jgi:hypothetical protein
MEWLAIRSFQHMQDLLNAINNLSIHVKLALAGVPDDERVEKALHAQKILISFLKELKKVIKGKEKANEQPVVGVDPRLRQLASNFVQAKQDRKRFRSMLFKDSVSKVEALLSSDNFEDRKSLLLCLEDLRILLEEHLPIDARQLIGEL